MRLPGALVNLSEYLDQMPNVVAMYGDTLNKTRYTDGNNYYLSNWYGYDPDPVNGFICRYDYMIELVGQERADSDQSFTWSEFRDLLQKFKDTIPGATNPLVIGDPVSGNINGMFAGMNSIYPYYVHEDKLYFSVRDPQFMDAIHQMNDPYRNGLLDPEWTSNNQELRNQKLSNNGVLAYAGAYWDTWTPSAALMAAENENAEYLAYKVIPDGAESADLPLAGRSSLGWDAVAITQWNSWFDAYLYTSSQDLKPMQSILVEILNQYQTGASTSQQMAAGKTGAATVTPDSIRMAATMVATLPIIMVYPFIQKYFVKGIMLGAVKG